MKRVVHFSIYKDSLNAFSVGTDRHFQTLQNHNLNNTCTSYATVERLTPPPKSDSCSPKASAMSLLSFSEEINIIRKACCAEAWQTRSQIQKLVIMSDFEAIDSKIL